jgi:hypothetical protein
VLPSVLGVDGYNPSIIQYDVPDAAADAASAGAVPAKRAAEESTTAAPVPAAAKPKPVATAAPSAPAKKSTASSSAAAAAAASQTPAQRVDAAIATISRYRTGGDGGNALKLLLTFVRNVAENPQEPKYVVLLIWSVFFCCLF